MGQRHSIPHSKESNPNPSFTRKGDDASTPRLPGYSQLSLPPKYSPRLSPQNLPIDLVLKVARYLDPVSRLFLRYTNLKSSVGLPFHIDSKLGKLSKEPTRLVSQAQDLGPRLNESRRAPRYDLKREDGPQLPRHFLPDGFFGIGKNRFAAPVSTSTKMSLPHLSSSKKARRRTQLSGSNRTKFGCIPIARLHEHIALP